MNGDPSAFTLAAFQASPNHSSNYLPRTGLKANEAKRQIPIGDRASLHWTMRTRTVSACIWICAYLPLPHTSDETFVIRHSNSPSPSVRSFARPSATQMLRAASRQAVDPPRRPIRRRLRKRLRRPVLTFADGRAFHREQRRYRYGNGCDGDSDNRQRQRRALLTLFRTWKARPLPCADSDSFLQFLHVPVTNVVFSGALRKCSCLVAQHIAYVCVYL